MPLTDAQWAALQRLQDYDLAPVRARLLKTGALPAERVDDAIFEFRRFLGLAVVGYDRRLAVVAPPSTKCGIRVSCSAASTPTSASKP